MWKGSKIIFCIMDVLFQFIATIFLKKKNQQRQPFSMFLSAYTNLKEQLNKLTAEQVTILLLSGAQSIPVTR